MSKAKKILLVVLALLLIIQFIRPSKNQSEDLITDRDISKKYTTPDAVHKILVQKCYDCHSNRSNYPWYFNIQPVGWWMDHHITEGKEHLNFSEFTTYTEKRANHKMNEVSEAVNEGWMPIDSYLWTHHDAKITQEDRDAVNAWIKTLGIPQEEEHH